MLEQIKKKQGQSGYVYARLACLSPEDGAAAVRELIAEGAIYKHPVGGLLYVSTNQNKPKTEAPTEAPQQKTKREYIKLGNLKERVEETTSVAKEEAVRREESVQPVPVPAEKREPVEEESPAALEEKHAESVAEPAPKKPHVPRPSSRKTVPSPDEIYEYIKKHGPQPAFTVAAHFGFRSQAFNHILLAMCHAGKIFRKERTIDRKFIYSISEDFDPNVEHLATLASSTVPLPGTPQFQEFCYKVIAAISELGGAATAQQITEYFDYKYTYNEVNQVVSLLNQRSRVAKQQGGHPSAATVWVLSKRVTPADTNNFAKSGKLVKNVKDSVTYWDLPDTQVETVLSEIESFLNPSLKIEKPDPQWVPVINKLATGIGGNAGAMLGDVASYLDSILKME